MVDYDMHFIPAIVVEWQIQYVEKKTPPDTLSFVKPQEWQLYFHLVSSVSCVKRQWIRAGLRDSMYHNVDAI